jgi:ABC-type transport system involved in cytochrome c biogenesis ATPase subunit
VAGEVQTTALDRIDLDIDAGEYVAITGPSGCGKSTLLSVLGLLDVPNSGEYWFEGQNVAGWSEARLNALRRGKVGFIFQSFNLIEELSVFENVELALEYTGTPAAERRTRVTAMLSGWAWRTAPATALRSCRAASSSAWRSRARWWPARRCCWPTNRPATSIPRTATKSCACCAHQRRRHHGGDGDPLAGARGPGLAHPAPARRPRGGRRTAGGVRSASMITCATFRIGWRLLVKEPAYSAVVVLGLAVGFAACFLLLGYVRHSLSYDRQVPEREQVYRLMQRWNNVGSDGGWSRHQPAGARCDRRQRHAAAGQRLHRTQGRRAHWRQQVQTISVTVVDPDFRRSSSRPAGGDLAARSGGPDALA